MFNKILEYKTRNKIIVKIQKRIRDIFNISFVPTNFNNLKKNTFTTNSFSGNDNLRFYYQEEIIKKFKETNNLVTFNTYKSIIKTLEKLSLDKDLKFNFLDFGGENIDVYLNLKKNFKNINYFVHNEKKINNDFIQLKKKYKFENLNIIENLDKICLNSYDFICFGSVIQYIENYEKILLISTQVSKKYILFTATHFFSQSTLTKKNIIVRQVNFLPSNIYCYILNFDKFMEIFTRENFSVIFKEKNNNGNVKYNNFNKSYGNIIYADLLLSR